MNPIMSLSARAVQPKKQLSFKSRLNPIQGEKDANSDESQDFQFLTD